MANDLEAAKAELERRRRAKSQQPSNADLEAAKAELERRKASRNLARNPDGTYGQPPEGAFMNEAGQMVDPAMQQARDQRVLDAYGRGTGFAVEYLQGTPFVGEWLDEGLRAVGASGMADRMNEVSGAYERQNPGMATTAGIAGGVVSSLPLAAGKAGEAAARFIGAGRGLMGKAGRSAVVAAAAGAPEVALQSAGRAEPGERIPEALRGAAIGAAGGAAVGPLVTLLGAGASAAYRNIRKLDVTDIANTLDVPKRVARQIRGYLQNEDFQSASRALRNAGDDAMLVDAGVSTRQALDDAMQTGGQALSIGRKAVTERARGAGDKFTGTLNSVLGDADTGLREAQRQASQRTAGQRKAAYRFAYSQPTPTTGPAAAKIDDALNRAEPSTLRAALAEAEAEMRFDGYTNQNIMASIAEDGTVKFSQPLSVLQLDYIARGLANVADEATDKVTGQTTRPGVRAMQLATQIRDAMRDAKNGGVKGYDRALTLGRDAIRERQAIITGRRMLTQNVTLEDVKDVLRGAPDAVRAGMRKGLRQNIENIMDNARVAVADLEGSYDFATGQDAAKSALAAMQNMLKPANVKKMRALLGDEADTLMKEMQRMSATVTLKAAVARGSQTAIRTAGREAIQENAQGGLLRRSLGKSGGLTSATQELTEAAAGVDPNTVRQMVASDAAEIVRVLTQIRGDDARRALIAVRRSMRGQPVRDEEALLIGRLVGIGSAAGTSQSDLQLIGR